MKNTAVITCLLFILFACPAAAQDRGLGLGGNRSSGGRVALVIGNSAYEAAPLKNPVNDAQDIAQSLRELGFEVLYKENLGQNDMKRSIRTFGEKLRGGGVGLFYYAGHGMQVKGQNYLIPVGAVIEKEEEVEYEAVDVGLVLAQMESAGNSMNIVILDACRNNPFARSFRSASNGLASIDAPSGTLIAYATAPGRVASDGDSRNGLYTQELLKFMRVQGLSIEEVFKRVRISLRDKSQGKQVPWESSSLVGDFYFTGDGKASAAKTTLPKVSADTAVHPSAATQPQSPPETEQAAPPKTLSGGVLNGKAISLPAPPYPPAARAVRVSGTVAVQVTINEEGRVVSASAVSGHPLLQQAAVEAAYKAVFTPTRLSGQAVKVTGVIQYNFTAQ